MNRVAKFLAHEGRVSLVVAHTTEMVEEIRNIHVFRENSLVFYRKIKLTI